MKLKEISITMSSGSTPSRKNLDFWNSKDIKWLKTQEINKRYVESTLEFVDEKTNIKVNSVNDIVIAMYGETRGKVSILKSKMATNQACCVIRCDGKSAYYLYLYYVLVSKYKELYKMGNGGAQQNLSVALLKDFEVNVPSLEKQKEIADRISVYDDKIENNNKIVNTLEEMASLLYKRYFVDFEFPNDEGKPYKSNGGQFVGSKLGQIPIGWNIITLNDICNVVNGYNFKSGEHMENGKYNIITIKCVNNGIVTPLQNISRNDIPEKVRKDQMLEIGDLLMTLTGNVGRVGIVCNENLLLNQRVAKIESTYSKFLYFYFKENIKLIESLGKGSVQQNLSTEELKKIILPFNKKLDLYEFDLFYDKIKYLNMENKILEKTRDLLINELVK